TVERSSYLSVSCLVTFLILVFFCGLGLLIACFINTNSMIQRYNTAASILNRGSNSRKHLINAAHYLKLAQLTGSKFAPELISHLGNEMNISYNRQRLKKECDGLKALAEELYRDSTGVASQVWRDITLIPIVHYESGEIV